MASKVLSIEIGANYTRVCLTDYKAKSPKVYKYAKIETPDNILMDGEVQATPEFISLLKETIKNNGMNSKQVVFPITSSKVATREVTIPYVKEKQIDPLIRANIKDYFPIDLSQHELGFLQLSSNPANNERKVLLLAVPRLILDSYKKLAAALNLQMVAADYSGNSIFEMVKNDCKDGVKMVVKVDEVSSIVTIVENSAIVLQRNISYGIDDAVQTIVNNSAFEASTYDEALDLAFRKTCMKLSINAKELRESDEESATDDAKLLAAKQEVSGSLNMLLNGIARIMDYYGSRNGGKTVDNIYITGLGADFSGLSKLITNELGIKTVGLKHLEGHNIEKQFKDGRFGEYITCVGASINPVGFMGATEEVGKSSSSSKKASSGKSYLAVGVLLFLLGIVVAGGLAFLAITHNQEAKARYNRDAQRLNELSEIRTIYATHESIKVVRDQVDTMYAMTVNHNEELLDFLAEMERKLPSDVSIQTFSAVLDSVTMTMNVSSKEEMANAIQELRNFDSVGDVTITGATDTTDAEGVPVVTFTITCIYADAVTEE